MPFATEQEERLAGELRVVAEAEDESLVTLVRFLRARQHNVAKAAAMLRAYRKWHAEYRPNNVLLRTIYEEIARARAWFAGRDRDGRPAVFSVPARHVAPGNVALVIGEVVFFFQLAIRLAGPTQDFTVVVDLANWGLRNVDYPVIKEGLALLQNCYPERLGKAFVLNAPFVFHAVWKIVKPWIDPRTVAKIAFPSSKEIASTLLQYFDKSQLPRVYGGENDFVYDTERWAPCGCVGTIDGKAVFAESSGSSVEQMLRPLEELPKPSELRELFTMAIAAQSTDAASLRGGGGGGLRAGAWSAVAEGADEELAPDVGDADAAAATTTTALGGSAAL